jgi:hypothetical protein
MPRHPLPVAARTRREHDTEVEDRLEQTSNLPDSASSTPPRAQRPASYSRRHRAHGLISLLAWSNGERASSALGQSDCPKNKRIAAETGILVARRPWFRDLPVAHATKVLSNPHATGSSTRAELDDM